MAQQKIVQTAGRTQLGEFAPEFAHLNDDILFGEVWSRNDLLFIARPQFGNNHFAYQPRNHRQFAEISLADGKEQRNYPHGSGRNHHPHRLLRRLAKAWAAFNLAKEVWNEDVKGEDAKAAFQREMIFPVGEPNTAYAKYFKGQQLSCENI